MTRVVLYTPGQVFAGSFIGGPAAAVIMLRRNFFGMQKSESAQKTLIWGTLLTIAMIVAIYLLPKNFPNVAFPAAYSAAAQYVASAHQKSKASIEHSDVYARRSNWHVFWLGLGCLAVSAAVFFIVILVVVAIVDRAVG